MPGVDKASASRIREDAASAGGRALEVHAGTPRINRWYYDQFAEHVRGRVLEVGAGIGNLTQLIAEDATELIATEVDPSHLAQLAMVAQGLNERDARAKVSVVGYDLEGPAPEELRERPFDVVMSCNVIEHLEDDVSAITRLAELLRPGGALLTYVPACPFVYGTIDEALGHYRRYTPKTFDQVVRAAGLVPERSRYMNTLGLLGWWLNGRVLKKSLPDPSQVGLFEKLMPLVRLEDHIRVPVGLGVISIATKPTTVTP